MAITNCVLDNLSVKEVVTCMSNIFVSVSANESVVLQFGVGRLTSRFPDKGIGLLPPLRRIQENESSQNFYVLYPTVGAIDYSKQF